MNYNNSYIKLLLSSTIMNLMSSSIEYSTDLINRSIIQYVLRLTIIKNSIKNRLIIHKINHNNIINDVWDEWCENELKRRRSTNLGVFFSPSSSQGRRPEKLEWWWRPLIHLFILGYNLSEGYFSNFPLKPLKFIIKYFIRQNLNSHNLEQSYLINS